jgi:hypothetical protein
MVLLADVIAQPPSQSAENPYLGGLADGEYYAIITNVVLLKLVTEFDLFICSNLSRGKIERRA